MDCMYTLSLQHHETIYGTFVPAHFHAVVCNAHNFSEQAEKKEGRSVKWVLRSMKGSLVQRSTSCKLNSLFKHISTERQAEW